MEQPIDRQARCANNWGITLYSQRTTEESLPTVDQLNTLNLSQSETLVGELFENVFVCHLSCSAGGGFCVRSRIAPNTQPHTTPPPPRDPRHQDRKQNK
eukprot:scaffold152030_cov56-Cyclotella_meneghiniana.AAC.5